MTELADHASQAAEAAEHAAADAGADVADVHALEDLGVVVDLLDAVWGRPPEAGHAVPRELLVALTHAGCQVSAARRGGTTVGATVALLGRSEDSGQAHLHSHITGVVGGAQGAGIGWALKQHQRAWALARGLAVVRWTFDPLVRRNAVFNLVKLGARPVAFLPDCYGPMDDDLNQGLPTDRLAVRWDLTERRVVAASEGDFHEPRPDALRRTGAAEVLVDEGGEPRTAPVEGPRVLAQVPDDIEDIRAAEPDRARRWARALRTTLGVAVDEGYRVSGVTRDGWYVLVRKPDVAELSG